MTTLNGDKCPTCGYAYEVFDRACPRCHAANEVMASRLASHGGWLSARTLRFMGYIAFWAALAAAVASIACAWMLRALANL